MTPEIGENGLSFDHRIAAGLVAADLFPPLKVLQRNQAPHINHASVEEWRREPAVFLNRVFVLPFSRAQACDNVA
jgi:hypothetical protein